MTAARPTPLSMKPRAPMPGEPLHRAIAADAEYALLRSEIVPTVRGEECHWVIVRPPTGTKHQPLISGSFNAAGMSEAEAAEEVVRAVIDHYRASQQPTRLCAPQQAISEAFLHHEELPGTLTIGSTSSTHYAALNYRATVLLTKIKVKAHAELNPWDSSGEDDYKKTGQRTVYVDASMTTDSGTVGAGYVIRDVYINRSLQSEQWGLTFGSTVTKYMRHGGNTHAELSAILAVLRETKAVNHSVRRSRQSLLVVSDSKYSIELLNLLRYDTPVTFDEDIHSAWRETAEQILFLLHDVEVEFEWVKGHANDPLNVAADALAISTRKSIESAHRNDDDIEFYRGRVISQTITTLNTQGIIPKVVG